MSDRAFIPVLHAATEDRPDEIDTLVSAAAVARSLKSLGYRTQIIRVGLDLRAIERLASRAPRLVFNLVEALTADMRMASIVPATLERFGIGYTGASFDALAATLSKVRAKQLMRAAGLPTPDWSETGEGLAGGRRYLVKSIDEHASVGIDGASIVDGFDAAAEIVARQSRFGGRFFAECYVEGREFNISLVEGAGGVEVLPMPEIVFEGFAVGQPRIVDYDAKWNEDSYEYHHTPRLFGVEQRQPGLAAELRAIALGTWELFGLTGYARVDFRVGADGRPVVIDVNTNPCIAPDAGLAAAAKEAGLDYDRLVARVVDAGLARARRIGPRVGLEAPADMPEPMRPTEQGQTHYAARA